MLEHIINSAQNLYLAVKDKNFQYTYCNDNIAKLHNLDSPKQIIGKSDSDFVNLPNLPQL